MQSLPHGYEIVTIDDNIIAIKDDDHPFIYDHEHHSLWRPMDEVEIDEILAHLERCAELMTRGKIKTSI